VIVFVHGTQLDSPPPLPPSPQAHRIILGLDLGEVKDFTALTGLLQTRKVVDGQRRLTYACKLLERWPLHTAYERIINDVGRIAARLPAAPELVLDGTGAGRPVCQMVQQARLPIKSLVRVIITGGTQVLQGDDGYWHVAKRELVSVVQSALQGGRLQISTKLKLEPVLTRELRMFRVKININTKNESFESWRVRDHDDTVLATALAIWWGERGGKRVIFGC
jgi:hypothetical protein